MGGYHDEYLGSIAQDLVDAKMRGMAVKGISDKVSRREHIPTKNIKFLLQEIRSACNLTSSFAPSINGE